MNKKWSVLNMFKNNQFKDFLSSQIYLFIFFFAILLT